MNAKTHLTSRALLLGFAIGVSACSCGPEVDKDHSADARRYASSACEASSKCACASHFSSQSNCADELAERFDRAKAALTFGSSCLDELVAAMEDCTSADDWTDQVSCDVFTGTKKQGESCSPHVELPLISARECGPGLLCLGGTCLPSGTPNPKSVGESCDDTVPGSCSDADLYCGSDEQCHETAVEGETCRASDGCFDPTFQSALHCAGLSSGAGTCEAQAPVGEVCDPLDAVPCLATIDGKSATPSHCDPATKTCVPGRGTAICEAFSRTAAWP